MLYVDHKNLTITRGFITKSRIKIILNNTQSNTDLHNFLSSILYCKLLLTKL